MRAPQKRQSKSKAAVKAKATPYVVKDDERPAFEELQRRNAAHPPAPWLKVKRTESGGFELGASHEDPQTGLYLQAHALGLHTLQSLRRVHAQLLGLNKNAAGEVNEGRLNGMVSMVESIGPNDVVESMLAVQMVAIHDAAMMAARRLHDTTSIELLELYGKQTEKLSRTYAELVGALKGYRSKGDQKIAVEHRHYHLHQDAAGETPGVGVDIEKEQQPHVRSLPQRPTVHGQVKANGRALPRPSGERLVGVSVPRRKGRAATRAGS